MRRFVLAALLLVAAKAAEACSVSSLNADTILTNEPVLSSNGWYCAIERWYEGVKDFESARADTLLWEPRETLTFALYDMPTRKRLSEFSIPFNDDGQLLVSDSGYIAIVRPLRTGCYGPAAPEHAFVTITRPDGTRVARLSVADILTASDILAANDIATDANVTASIRAESYEREVLVLMIQGRKLRIDLATATMLDPKENLFPGSVVFADAASRAREYTDPFDATPAVRLSSKEVLAQAVEEPLPDFPDVARKAHVLGVVWVQVIVSAFGNVIEARATPLPFGLKEAALTSVKKWRFRPLQVDGKRVQFSGEVAVHFEKKLIP